MKLNGRTLAWWAGGAALLVAFGLWLASATEWATRDVWEPPKGEAATDRHFLVKRFLARVGAVAQAQQGLTTLPPEGATLVLEARHWSFREGRAEALKAWVERGGHLLVYSWVGDDEFFERWLQVRYRPLPKPKRPPAASAPAPASAAADEDDEDEEDSEEDDEPACPPLAEPAGEPGWYGTARHYKVCVRGQLLQTRRAGVWSVSDAAGLRVLRVPAGRGSVTLSTEWGLPFRETLLEEDQAALLAAQLQLRPGQRIWLVTDEESPGIVAALWRQAPAALLLGLLALALLLWRWGTRFAPLQAEPPLARRSMAEQVRGTAAYLLRHGPAALHRAQRRALEDAADAHLPGWRRLPEGQRSAALARHASLPHDQLAKALDPASARDPASTGRALALMEAARRRIAEPGATPPTPPTPPSRPSAEQEPTP